jgi:predicted ATPase
MNRQPRSSRVTSQGGDNIRRESMDHDALLPWADPYIASLMRQHERQMRGQQNAQRARA